MWALVRRLALYFLVGFVVAFTVYLFIRFDSDAVLLGMGIAAVAGFALAALLWWLDNRYEQTHPPQIPGR